MSDSTLSRDELQTAALRGLRLTVISRPVIECVMFASMVVLARLVSPAGFGRYSVALVFAELMLVPASAVGAALVQRPDIGKDYMQTGVTLALLLGLAIMGISWLCSSVIITPIFGNATAELVRLATAGCIINSASIVPSAMLQRRLAFRRMSVLQVVNTVVRAIVSIALALGGLDAKALLLGGLAGGLAGTMLNWAWAPPPIPRFNWSVAKDIGRYGGPAAGAAISWVGFRNCDYAIVGARLGELQAGFYFRAYTLGVEYQKKISQVLNSMGFPLLARTQTTSEQDRLRGQMIRLLTLVLFPTLVILGIVAPVLIPWVFGSEWSEAVVPTQILVFGGAVTLVIDGAGAQIMAAGRTRALMGYGWGHFIVYGLAVYLVAPWGITAVAAAAAVVHTLFMVVAYVVLVYRDDGPLVAKLKESLDRIWHDLAPATVACLGLALAAVPLAITLSDLGLPPMPYVLLVGLCGTAVYLLVLRLAFPDALRSMVRFIGFLIPIHELSGIPRRLRSAAAGRPALSSESTH